jgi:hypothetical protein
MDTGDVVLMADVAELWRHFVLLEEHPAALFGATKEQARWYWRLSDGPPLVDKPSTAKLPWSKSGEPWCGASARAAQGCRALTGRPPRRYDEDWAVNGGPLARHGINAGVLLLHLGRMRRRCPPPPPPLPPRPRTHALVLRLTGRRGAAGGRSSSPS